MLNAICMYRSPSSDVENNNVLIRDFEKILDQKASHLLVMGDFNLKDINWEDSSCGRNENYVSEKFLEITQDLFLHQHISSTTRHREGNTPSRVDLIFTNEENMVNNVRYLPPLWSNTAESDHLLIEFDFLCYAEEKEDMEPGYNYKAANFSELKEMIDSHNWEELAKDKKVEDFYKIFKNIYNTAVEKCIPKFKSIKRKVGNKPIWMSQTGLSKIRKKHKAWQRYMNTREGQDFQNYVNARNSCKSHLRKLIKEFETEISKNVKHNPKQFWKYINSKSKTKTGINSLEDEQGNLIHDNSKKAEILNNYFSSVFTREDINNIPQVNETPEIQTFNLIATTRETIRKKIEKLKSSKSPGPDNCHPRVIKEMGESIITPLLLLFNLSIEKCQIPTEWKYANIAPIHKKGHKTLSSNYRPISLTSIICKLLESCIRDQLLTHIRNNNLFTDDQYGFLPHRSCALQLITIMEHWTKLIDEGSTIDTVYLDFSKAFDSVPHQRLLMKLKKFNIGERTIAWISDFLKNRKQRVCVSGKFSNWTDVISGVPQGSVLGPILFLIYINDLPETINSFVKIFADDTKIYQNVDKQEERYLLQADIEKANEWANKWQLPFNKSKCKIMHIGKQNPLHSYTIGTNNEKVNVEIVEEEKDLGIVFDKDLSFKNHMNMVITKSNKMLGIIKRGFQSLDSSNFIPLYKSLVRSHLEYGNTVWRPYKREDIIRLEKVQRRATKCVTGIEHLEYVDRLKILKLPTLEFRRDRGDMLQTYKILHNIDNTNKNIFFNLANNSRTRGHSLKLLKPNTRLEIRKNSFGVRINNNWNSLTEEIVSAPSLNSFKNRLDKFWEDKKYIY